MKWSSLILGLCLLTLDFAHSAEVILVNQPDSPNDERYLYPERLLQRVLDRTSGQYGPARVEHASSPMSRDRIFSVMKVGKEIHVIAEAPKPGWEEALIAVRIPLRKGIQGYRLFLIKEKNRSLIKNVKTLEDLMKLPTGSGSQWSTAPVMQAAGFSVVHGSSYDGLFAMLQQERFITFGRGINEAFREQETYQSRYPDLVVDDEVMLYIPLPTYFFVTPTRPELAKRIETGLRAMIQDGSFDEFFYTYYAQDIVRADMGTRRVFRIPNHTLSPETPLQDASLWFNPQLDLPKLKLFLEKQRMESLNTKPLEKTSVAP